MQFQFKALRAPALACCALLAFCCGPLAAHAQDSNAAQCKSTAPDNSKRNKAHHTTADKQSGNASDRTITQNIRKALMADKSLSTYGHNVKIITLNGAVTLKGPVHSEEEKQSIAAKATEVAGQDKVTNQLTVK